MYTYLFLLLASLFLFPSILASDFTHGSDPERVQAQSSRTRRRSVGRLLRASSVAPRSSSNSPNPCGDLVNSYLDHGTIFFAASDVHRCLISVPFNSTDATSLINYLSETLEFQSTLAYLKNPPPSYQQPSIDLMQGLDFIQAQIDAEAFQSQYSFEAAVQRLIQRTHDGNINLNAGVLSLFLFGSPITIVSVSDTAMTWPKLYVRSDLDAEPSNLWKPSAISLVNGYHATDYFTRFAKTHAVGGLEPHTDYNLLMDSPAADIQGYVSAWDLASPFYPGDSLDITFENGTKLPRMHFQAYALFDEFQNPEMGSASSQAFYDYFALFENPDGLTGQSQDNSVTRSSTPMATSAATASSVDTFDIATLDVAAAKASETASPSPPSPRINTSGLLVGPDGNYVASSWPSLGYKGYPSDPVVTQSKFGFGGFVSGYHLKQTGVAVLSIPSFIAEGSALATFSNAVEEFLEKSKAAGMKQLVIDVQQNFGGSSILAIDTFKHLFPELEPFGGRRMRSSTFGDAIGNTLTDYYRHLLENPSQLNQTYLDALIADPFAPLNVIDASTNRTFRSWPEQFGPHKDRNDFFSTVQRSNLSDTTFTVVASSSSDDTEDGRGESVGIGIYGYGARKPSSLAAAFAPQDIVVLTDAACTSACALFVESLTEIGVKTVVAGGQPIVGPMQAVGGNRGAQSYDSFSLDADIFFASAWNRTAARHLPQNREKLNFAVWNFEFNLMDQIRQGENFPLQFAYEPADCRIFFTKANWNNLTALWQDAADAIWSKSWLCVKDSTGYNVAHTDTDGPSAAAKAAWKKGYAARTVNTAHFMPSSSEEEVWDSDTIKTYDLSHLLQPNSIEDGIVKRIPDPAMVELPHLVPAPAPKSPIPPSSGPYKGPGRYMPSSRVSPRAGTGPKKATGPNCAAGCATKSSGCSFVFSCTQSSRTGLWSYSVGRGTCVTDCVRSSGCSSSQCFRSGVCSLGRCRQAPTCRSLEILGEACYDPQVINQAYVQAGRLSGVMYSRGQSGDVHVHDALRF